MQSQNYIRFDLLRTFPSLLHSMHAHRVHDLRICIRNAKYAEAKDSYALQPNPCSSGPHSPGPLRSQELEYI